MTNILARLVSYLFHPVFVVSYFLLILLIVNPFIFGSGVQSTELLLISVIALTVIFPLVVVFLLRGLGMLSSLEMTQPTERIGPLLATGLFYLWLFVNIRNNPNVPIAFSLMVLGATIGLFIGFFINNFSKISLHTIGVSGLATAVVIVKLYFSYEYFALDLGSFGSYNISVDAIMFFCIFIAGLVGTCRLYLGSHKSLDVMGGYLVGIVSQLIALRILL